MDGDGGGDCGGDFFVTQGGDSGGLYPGVGSPRQPNPIDERPKINGAPVQEQTHEYVIRKNNA